MKKLIFSVMLLSIFGLGLQAQEKSSCCSKDAKAGACCGISNITPEQQKQMDALKANHQKEMMDLKNQLKEKEAHYVTVTTGSAINEKDAEKTLDEMSVIHLSMAKKKLAHQMAVRKILTEEQKVEFDKHHAKMGAHGHDGCMGGQHQGDGKKCNHDGKEGSQGCKGQMQGKSGSCSGSGSGPHGNGAGCCKGSSSK